MKQNFTSDGRSTKNRLEWGNWVTPKLLKNKPIHRWYVFPHSFTGELVQSLIDEWELTIKDNLLDPFCGAGTTLVTAREAAIPATGYDLSPLAILASRVKISHYDIMQLRAMWTSLKHDLSTVERSHAQKDYPDLIGKALPNEFLGTFESIADRIHELPCSQEERDFFMLALLSTLPMYSKAVATGGWLRWVENKAQAKHIPSTFTNQVEGMLNDLQAIELPKQSLWGAVQADARSLPAKEDSYTAVITSPPYPNRHDYTRVFGVELMFAFLSAQETKALRYQSFHSHPEAKPARLDSNGYTPPEALLRSIREVNKTEVDSRVPRMLEGYCLDMFIALKEIKRVCRIGSRIALVVGNVQYRGVPFYVDELTADIGEQVGLSCSELLVARLRGNSAQQMGVSGRNHSRETVVVFRVT